MPRPYILCREPPIGSLHRVGECARQLVHPGDHLLAAQNRSFRVLDERQDLWIVVAAVVGIRHCRPAFSGFGEGRHAGRLPAVDAIRKAGPTASGYRRQVTRKAVISGGCDYTDAADLAAY